MDTEPTNEELPSTEYIPSTVAAALVGPLGNSTQVRISFQPYGNQDCGNQDPEKPNYRCIDGEMTGVEGYAHIKTEDNEWYVLADGEEFAPSHEEWFGKELLDEFEDVSQLPTPPLSDSGPVLGKRADDNNGYVAVGINPVVLLPTPLPSNESTASSQSSVDQTPGLPSEHITNARKALYHFEDNTPAEAKRAVTEALKDLRAAKAQINTEHLELEPPTEPEPTFSIE